MKGAVTRQTEKSGHDHRPTALAGLLLLLMASQPGWTQESESFECLMEPMVVTQVGSPVQGVIRELLVDRSAVVQRGQPIAELDAQLERAALEQAQIRANMKSEIQARDADLELARQNVERLQNLHQQRMVPAQQKDEAVAEYQVAVAAQKQAQENYTLLQQELKRAVEQLSRRTIRSPVTGVVVEQRAFAGEFVYENPVMTIAQLDPLRIEVVLPARYYGRFKTNDTATVFPEIGSETPLQARVDVVDRMLDNRSGTFGVRLTLPNPGMTIPGGQKCRLEFGSEVEKVSAR